MTECHEVLCRLVCTYPQVSEQNVSTISLILFEVSIALLQTYENCVTGFEAQTVSIECLMIYPLWFRGCSSNDSQASVLHTTCKWFRYLDKLFALNNPVCRCVWLHLLSNYVSSNALPPNDPSLTRKSGAFYDNVYLPGPHLKERLSPAVVIFPSNAAADDGAHIFLAVFLIVNRLVRIDLLFESSSFFFATFSDWPNAMTLQVEMPIICQMLASRSFLRRGPRLVSFLCRVGTVLSAVGDIELIKSWSSLLVMTLMRTRIPYERTHLIQTIDELKKAL